MIVLNMEVLQAEAPKIGNPQMFHESKAAGAGAGAGGAHPGPAAQNIAPNLQQQQQQQQYGGPAPSAPQFGGARGCACAQASACRVWVHTSVLFVEKGRAGQA